QFTPLYTEWKTVRNLKGDPQGTARKTQVKADIKALLTNPDFVKDLQDAQTVINEVAHDRAVAKLIATVIAMIVITIVSMGIGTAVGMGLTTALAGSVAAGTMAAGTALVIAEGAALLTEAAVFTA